MDMLEIQRLQSTLLQQQMQTNSAAGGDFSKILQDTLLRGSTGPSSGSLDEIFERAAQETGVPVSILKALGKTESNFNPSATSSCGAMGVMQLMPATAKTLGVTDPYNAEQNIMGGARHFRNMLDRFDGDTTLALAAYNAGSGNVYKHGGVPPFPETQNFVRKVLSYAGQDLTAGSATWSAGGLTQTGQADPLRQSIMNADDAKLLADMFSVMIQWRLSAALNGSEEEPPVGMAQILQTFQQA